MSKDSRPTLLFLITLITFIAGTCLSKSFAQVRNGPEPLVRIIYFMPRDRQPQPDIDAFLDTEIKNAQLLFADVLEEHGFERKTFQFETDARGKAVVHHVRGKYTAAHYSNFALQSDLISAELSEHFDVSKNIHLVSVDMGPEHFCFSNNNICGFAYHTTDGAGGIGVVPVNDTPAVAHELGHAFGLVHDYRLRPVVGRDPMLWSFCAAEWLDAHQYFNPVKRGFNTNTDFELHPIELVKFPAKVRLRITITDPDGLHQVQLFHPQWYFQGSLGEHSLASCQKLSGNHVIAEFVTDELIGYDNNDEFFVVSRITLKVLDAYGNITTREFDIAMPDIVRRNLERHVPIPDKNLAAAIRESLGLLSGDPITYRNILSLSELVAVDRNIKSVEGIENAIYLKDLNLLDNQIEDIKPISKLSELELLNVSENRISDITSFKDLKKVRQLSISKNQISDISVLPLMHLSNDFDGYLSLGGNPIRDYTPIWKLTDLQGLVIRDQGISDLSPLTELTRLTLLQLDGNNISDITPLSNITSLDILILYRNKITDTSPLVNLTNLRTLELQENPITNRKPLLALLQKNPDVKIYLNWDEVPLTKVVSIPDKVVSIPDPNLAKAVRKALGLGNNAPITRQHMLKLSVFDAKNSKIKNLIGLEHAKQLTRLNLDWNQIRKLNPLSGLTRLKTLTLDENEISNVHPLTDLTQLEWLLIGGNPIQNAGVRRLAELTQLKGLSLYRSQISNVTPLASLTKLENLWLGNNQIRDVSPLGKLTHLRVLGLAGNPIEDVGPLASLRKLEEVDIEIPPAAPTLVMSVPEKTDLHPNYPNPFNPETWIPYQLAAPADVRIAIYAADGALVRTLDLGHQSVGYYDSRERAAYWDGRNALGEQVSSGVYFYQLETDAKSLMRKMVILK